RTSSLVAQSAGAVVTGTLSQLVDVAGLHRRATDFNCRTASGWRRRLPGSEQAEPRQFLREFQGASLVEPGGSEVGGRILGPQVAPALKWPLRPRRHANQIRRHDDVAAATALAVGGLGKPQHALPGPDDAGDHPIEGA